MKWDQDPLLEIFVYCFQYFEDVALKTPILINYKTAGIESDPVATTAVKTNTARFTCVIRGDKAPSSITWSRDDAPVDMTTASVATTTVGVDTTTVLTLENVESAGKYKCSAVFDTPNGEVVSESADLRVLG